MTFQFRPWLAVFAAAGIALLISLGFWQLHRLSWKVDLIEQSQARLGLTPAPLGKAAALLEGGEDPEYMPVRIIGEYRYELEQRVFGTLDGAPGYYLFTPLEIVSETPVYIYINRGFVAQAVWEREPTIIERPKGQITAEGLFRSPETPTGIARYFAPSGDVEQGLWFIRDPRPMAEGSGIDIVYGYIDSFADNTASGWPKGGTTRLDFSNRHLEYALTWFGLAVALLGVWLVFSIRRL